MSKAEVALLFEEQIFSLSSRLPQDMAHPLLSVIYKNTFYVLWNMKPIIAPLNIFRVISIFEAGKNSKKIELWLDWEMHTHSWWSLDLTFTIINHYQW